LPTTAYRIRLSEDAELSVWFLTEHGDVISYAIVLLATSPVTRA